MSGLISSSLKQLNVMIDAERFSRSNAIGAVISGASGWQGNEQSTNNNSHLS